MAFGKIRTFFRVVIDDRILQLARVNFHETPEYHELLMTSTRAALSSSLRWLWLVGCMCSLFILTQREILSLEETQSIAGPLSGKIQIITLIFLCFLLLCALVSRLRWAKQISVQKNKVLAVGSFLMGSYWGLMAFLMLANQQVSFSVSLYFILLFATLAALYMPALCLYSADRPGPDVRCPAHGNAD